MQGWNSATMSRAILLTILILSSLTSCVYGGYGTGPGMMGGYGYGFWGILMLLFWVLVIVGIVLFVVWLVRQTAAPPPPPPAAGPPTPGGSRALDILQERYARGEITREQYEQMRHDLEAK